MSKSPTGEIPGALVLHVLNVLQPLMEIDVVTGLRATERFSNWSEDVIKEQVRNALVDLVAQGYVVQALNGRYILTYSGIQVLAEKGVAFPRDKNRLYFLKEAHRRRG
jgi:hypothetical protein